MKPGPFLFTWMATFIVLFILNALFHGVVAAGFFDTHFASLGDAVVKMRDFHPLPIVILELILDGSLVLIITRLRNERIVLKDALLIGGLFYLSTAASWNLANTASLSSWSTTVTIVDVSWHFLTGLLAGWIICRIFNRQFSKAQRKNNKIAMEEPQRIR